MAERAIATVPGRSVVATVRKALRYLPASERLEERRVGTGRYFPGGLPEISTRMAEGILAAIVALVVRSLPYTTTRELGMILSSISLAVLLVLGAVEFRNWKRWSID
ncbi:MAG TPA: hypothetical protein VGP87_12275 [Gemmatimonadales bacterium]|jgi:hypothetical protein|nr:hypothetical protein [Gemmatimonadales bacterium]